MSDQKSVTISIDICTANALRRLYEIESVGSDGDEVSMKTVVYSLLESGFDDAVRDLRRTRDNPILEDNLSNDCPPVSGIGFRDNRADFSEL